MELNKKTFPLHHNSGLSFLQLTNITSFQDAEAVLIDFNTFSSMKDKEIKWYINSKKIIYIDGTYEFLNNTVLEILENLSNILQCDLGAVHYFCNPVNHERLSQYPLLLKLTQKGLICTPDHYFIRYSNIYQPDINADTLPKQRYLCLTGKLNPSRTFLIALLSKYNLLQYGHVSYFGEDYIDKDFDPQKIDDYKTENFLSPSAKNVIEDEMKKLKLPLVADTNQFNMEISHTKKFNAELYSAVDFVIVPETTGCTMQDNFFPTEKTVKCILMNKKFIPLASKGFLRKLKRYYMTELNKDISHLTDWCDISFDDITDLEKRTIKVVNIVAHEISKNNKSE